MSSIQDLGAPDDPAFASIRRFIVSPDKAGTHQRRLDIPVIDPRPDDVGTLDGIIRAFYEVISGPAGAPRQWARDRTLYVPGARLVSTGVRDEKAYAAVMGHGEYAEASDGFLAGGFFEHETHRVTRIFGNVTHVWSTYEARRTPDGPVIARGVNSIQLIHDGARWWIVSAAWDNERPDNPISRNFLPR